MCVRPDQRSGPSVPDHERGMDAAVRGCGYSRFRRNVQVRELVRLFYGYFLVVEAQGEHGSELPVLIVNGAVTPLSAAAPRPRERALVNGTWSSASIDVAAVDASGEVLFPDNRGETRVTVFCQRKSCRDRCRRSTLRH